MSYKCPECGEIWSAFDDIVFHREEEHGKTPLDQLSEAISDKLEISSR